jgi:hypothetical protein
MSPASATVEAERRSRRRYAVVGLIVAVFVFLRAIVSELGASQTDSSRGFARDVQQTNELLNEVLRRLPPPR